MEVAGTDTTGDITGDGTTGDPIGEGAAVHVTDTTDAGGTAGAGYALAESSFTNDLCSQKRRERVDKALLCSDSRLYQAPIGLLR